MASAFLAHTRFLESMMETFDYSKWHPFLIGLVLVGYRWPYDDCYAAPVDDIIVSRHSEGCHLCPVLKDKRSLPETPPNSVAIQRVPPLPKLESHSEHEVLRLRPSMYFGASAFVVHTSF